MKLMLNILARSKISKSLLIILMLLLVLSSSLSMLHAFSHSTFTPAKNALVKAEVIHNSSFEKIIFAHEKSSGKKAEHCFLCAASNFQNQIFLTSNLIFVIAAFYLVFTRRYFDRVKLSYLFSSNTSRAPPVIS